MAKQKTEKRKLAELVAKQRGIKVQSAQQWLNRVAAGKVKKPKYDLTDYAKRKVRKFVRSEKAKAERKPRGPKAPKAPRPQFTFRDYETVSMQVKATFDFYGSDVRDRSINFVLKGDEANRVLNAPDLESAIEALKQSRTGAFLQGGDVRKFQKMTMGDREFRSEFWE